MILNGSMMWDGWCVMGCEVEHCDEAATHELTATEPLRWLDGTETPLSVSIRLCTCCARRMTARTDWTTNLRLRALT